MQLVVESGLRASAIGDLLARIAAGSVFFREVDLVSGAWQFREARATDQTDISDSVFSCLHGPRWRMLIIGASEIGVYLAEIAKTLDFRVTVCDPRDGYRDAWRVSDTTLTTEMPDDAVRQMVPDEHSVVIAVSHDPKLDDMALMEALNTRAFYVGAVGSQKTSDERRQRLTGLDVSPANAARLHGPVGLAIGSRTPPEIAVAIAAELVAARNRRVLVAAQPAERVA
jgi:xanthine dehydrogenase accessory factor